jgi:tetratricopeptide (TPR) repeat protein
MSAPVAGRGRRLLAGAGLLLLAGAALLGWRWTRQTPLQPPMPAGVGDAEIRAALQSARQEVLKAPASADAWGRLGMVLLAHLFDREADRCFAEAARLDPADARWPYGRALLALKLRPDEAVGLLRQAVAAQAPERDLAAMRMQLAEALLERGEAAEAEALFAAERQQRPGDARAAYGWALAVLARGDRAAARPALEAARRSPYARKKAAARLAAVAWAARDFAAAARLEKEADALPDDPAWPDPLLDAVVLLQVGARGRQWRLSELERQEKYEEAANEYLRQVEEHPTAPACVGAGVNLARLRDYDRAIPLLRRAVRLDPESAQAHYTLALTLYTVAEREGQTAAEAQPVRQGFTEALDHARRAAGLKPDHAQAYLFWGLCLKRLGRPAEAVAPLEKGVACNPNHFELQLALGEVLGQAGRPAEARTHLENARSLDPADPRPARALARMGAKKD